MCISVLWPETETITNHRRTSPWKIFSSCLDSKEPFISQTGFHSTSTITLLPFPKICLVRWSLIQISAGQTAACVCSLLMLWQANLGLLGSVKRLILCFISMADILVRLHSWITSLQCNGRFQVPSCQGWASFLDWNLAVPCLKRVF